YTRAAPNLRSPRGGLARAGAPPSAGARALHRPGQRGRLRIAAARYPGALRGRAARSSRAAALHHDRRRRGGAKNPPTAGEAVLLGLIFALKDSASPSEES